MTVGAGPRLLVAPFGEPAWQALVDTVRTARAGDPLAPVTICVPSAAAGVAIRRRLAHQLDGLANVACVSLADLVERLASPALAAEGRAPLSAVVAGEAIRAALGDEGAAGPFASVAASPATVTALTATFADLGALDEDGLARLAVLGSRQAALAGLYARVRAFTRGRWADEHERLALAAAAVDAGAAALDEIGPVVLHLPRRLRSAEGGLLRALARRERLWAVLGRSGVPAADEPLARMVAALSPLLGPPHEQVGPDHVEPLAGNVVVRAPDPAEEVRVALRLLVEQLDAGASAERLAVVARVTEPYALLLHEELAAAGIAHSAPAPGTLAQTTAGRVLLGVLALPDGSFRRADVLAWLRAAPVRAEPGGRLAPAPQWDRLARQAGIAGGPDQWQQRLARAREKRLATLEWRAAHQLGPTEAGLDVTPGPGAGPDGGGDGGGDGELDGKLAELDALASFVAELVVRTDVGERRGWRSLAHWADGLLDRYLGGDDVVAAWSDDEQRAHVEVRKVLAALAALDDHALGPPPDVAGFRQVLAQQLDRPAPRVGTIGRGVLVGRPADLAGADADLVVVLGMAEGTCPPRPVDDPLLPDRERVVLGLDRRAVERAEEHRDHLAAIAAAPRRVLCFARADPRSQRERQPARWLLDTCASLWGRAAVHGDDLGTLRAEGVRWFVDVESFEWWPATGRGAATPHEYDVATLVTARRAGLPLGRTAVVGAVPHLERGLAAVAARQAGRFGPWTGAVGPRPGFLADLEHPQSATGLETWATCPFRYLLGKVLGVAELDDPADADEMSAIDRGSLVHEVLERFVGERLGRPPDQPWSAADREALGRIADEVAAHYESEGRTGRALLWRLRWAQLRRHLDRLLTADDEQRRAFGVEPYAVELGFGFGDDELPPVVVDAGGGRCVAFRGRVDRVDLSPDGRRALVLDYKTANARSYPALAGAPGDIDMTGAGRHLQLLVYAEAARAATGAGEVDARFWFVRPGDRPQARGGPVDERARNRFHQVLSTVVDGVEQGHFPARPGEETFFGFANCSWCAYERTCGKGRGERWEGLRTAPELASYIALAEGDVDGNGADSAGPPPARSAP